MLSCDIVTSTTNLIPEMMRSKRYLKKYQTFFSRHETNNTMAVRKFSFISVAINDEPLELGTWNMV
jgi:hypothetical protein